MVLTVHTRDGVKQTMPAEWVLRIRTEAGRGTVIDTGKASLVTREPAEQIAGRLASAIRLVRLTSLGGAPVYFNVARVSAVDPPQPDDDPVAHASIVLGSRRQLVRESVVHANNVLYAARHAAA